MIPFTELNTPVTVKRRQSSGIDSLGNPVYGAPTGGWNTVATNVMVRFAFNTKMTRFAPEGERQEPTGVVYYNPGPDIRNEDRLITPEGYEYNVISVVPGYLFGKTVSHYEAVIQTP
jgi:hypothetical protein